MLRSQKAGKLLLREIQNLVFNFTKRRRKKEEKKSKLVCWPKYKKPIIFYSPIYFSSVLSNVHALPAVLTTWIVSSRISSAAHHNPHTNVNVIVVYLLMQELFADKIHFFKFLSSSDKLLLDQLPKLLQYCFSCVATLVVHGLEPGLE